MKDHALKTSEAVEVPNNVPAAASRLVGRESELTELSLLVAENRLVTIAGPGGCGKTRLAIELGARIVRSPDSGAHEACWLDLASVTDALGVVYRCARRLDVRLEADGRDPVAALVGSIRDRAATLILDTCEHLLTPLSELVERLITECPKISILTTSREPLGVIGEAVWRVPPLQPTEACELFVDRARLVANDVELSPSDPLIIAICNRLDGLPLAIEIVSASVRVFAPAQILTGLDERFRLLTGGLRRGTGRHRTLAASMAWSHDLLEPAEKTVFRQLAVFVGTFDVAAVEAVCDQTQTADDSAIAVLTRLVDKSLVIAGREGDRASYRLLDTVREFAADQLGHSGGFEQARDRHLAWCLRAMHEVEQALRTDQDHAMRIFDKIGPDASAALDWALQPDDQRRRQGRELAHLMVMPWFLRSQSHRGRPFLNRAIAANVEPDDELGDLLVADAAMLSIVAGSSGPDRRELHREVTGLLAQARFGLVRTFEAFFADHEAAEHEGITVSSMARAADDPFVEDLAVIVAAYARSVRELHAEALDLVAPATARSRARGDRFCLAAALGVKQIAALQSGRLPEAITLGREAVAVAEPLGDYFCFGTMTVNLATALSIHGKSAAARRLLQPIVAVVESTTEVDVIGLPAVMGYLCAREGSWEEALQWFDLGLIRLNDTGSDWTAIRCIPGAIEVLRALGRTAEAAALADRGQALGITAPEHLAKLTEQRAWLQPAGDPRAEILHCRALNIRTRTGMRLFIPDSLDALAGHHAHAHPSEAVRLLAACTRAREDMGYPRPRSSEAAYVNLLGELQATMGRKAYDEAWSGGLATGFDKACELAQLGRRRPTRPESGWASLTPTELGVASLVAQGMTNVEIAANLVVSRATVKTHLHHIFTKLDITNRTELASLAHANIPQPDSNRST